MNRDGVPRLIRGNGRRPRRARGRFAALPGIVLCLVSFAASTAEVAATRVSEQGLDEILAPPLHGTGMDRSADVTIVVYFDYNCPVCRLLDPELARLAAGDPGIRIVHKHWPIFGGVSAYAAYTVFAAGLSGRYDAAHAALMSSRSPLDSQATVDAVLRDAGFDVPALRAAITAHQREFSAELTRSEAESRALALRGTPGLLVGDQFHAGSLTPVQLRDSIRAARARQIPSQRSAP